MNLRISHLRALAVLSALLALLLWSAVAANSSASQVRALQPGDNLIGWVGAETTSSRLLQRIPSATLIYTWDAKRSTYLFAARRINGSLHTIRPGMGLIIRIDADEPVRWRQPSTGIGRRVSLQPGANLVAWTASNGTPIDLAVRDFEHAFVQALYWDRPGSVYRSYPDPDDGGRESHRLMHGDALWVFANAVAIWPQAEHGRPLHLIGQPPERVRWATSFDRYLDSDGIDILASEGTSDEALFRAAELIDNILINRPDIRDAMVLHGYQVVIVGAEERTFDLPPYSELQGRYDEAHDALGGPRGLGGSKYYPTLFPEEGLLCLPSDVYGNYSLSVHEFAHTVETVLLLLSDADHSQPHFRDLLIAVYEEGLASRFWEGSYAASNATEFWAETVTIWMGVYGSVYRPDSSLPSPDPRVTSRRGIDEHASYTAELIVDTLGDVQFTASCKVRGTGVGM